MKKLGRPYAIQFEDEIHQARYIELRKKGYGTNKAARAVRREINEIKKEREAIHDNISD